MHSDMPKTINEALKILAYNDYFWVNSSMLGNIGVIKPHPKDYETVRSLAESQYPWTEKQASDLEEIPDKVPSTRNGHQKVVRQTKVR